MQNHKERPIFKTNKEDVNYFLLMQENFYCGPIIDIVSEKLAMYLIEKPVMQLEKYFSMFISLSNKNKVYFLIYGDFNGDKIPEQYQKAWKEMLPKLLETAHYLLESE